MRLKSLRDLKNVYDSGECVCMASTAAVCVYVFAFPSPRLRWTLPLWDVFAQCRASQMNGLWLGEVSLVALEVTQIQWQPGLYRKNKNRDPQAHGPCHGRGLDMVGHFRKIKKKFKKKERSGFIRSDVLDLKHRAWISQVLPACFYLSCTLYLGGLFTAQWRKNKTSIKGLSINFTPNNIKKIWRVSRHDSAPALVPTHRP